LLPAACDRPPAPKGQVLASVGGEAITKRDLQGELGEAARLGAREDGPALALDRLVERELLLRAARERELDLSPEYLLAIRRARADILIDMFNDQVASQVPAPSAGEIASFMAQRPWMFADRAFLIVDELVVRAAADDIRTLAGAASIEDAVAQLGARRISFSRSVTRLDTAQLTPDDATALQQGQGRRVVMLSGETPRLVAARSREPAVIQGAEAERVADAVIRRERLSRRLEAIVAKERANVQIRYREGFGPAAR